MAGESDDEIKADAVKRYMTDVRFRTFIRIIREMMDGANFGMDELRLAAVMIEKCESRPEPRAARDCGCFVGIPHVETCPLVEQAMMLDGECFQDAEGNFILPSQIRERGE